MSDTVSLGPDQTRAAALEHITRQFAAAGLDEPRREARALLLAVLSLRPADLLLQPDHQLADFAFALTAAVNRRCAREPLARIIGHKEFYGLDFALNEATLVPRPDTETLVEAVLDHVRARGLESRPLRILDLGIGSGILLAALLHHLPLARGIGVDLAPEAVDIARENLDRHLGPGRAVIQQGNWLDGLDGPFDIIVSNPPYIVTAEIETLDADVRDYDPRLALDGGNDGLDAYRKLAMDVPAYLAPDGVFGLELGAGQATSVTSLCAQAGLQALECRPDLGGHPRALILAHADRI